MHSKVALRARTERVSLKQLFQVRWDLTTTASDDHLISVTATPYSADLDASPMRGAHHSALVDSSDNETVIIRAQEGCRTGAFSARRCGPGCPALPDWPCTTLCRRICAGLQ